MLQDRPTAMPTMTLGKAGVVVLAALVCWGVLLLAGTLLWRTLF